MQIIYHITMSYRYLFDKIWFLLFITQTIWWININTIGLPVPKEHTDLPPVMSHSSSSEIYIYSYTYLIAINEKNQSKVI